MSSSPTAGLYQQSITLPSRGQLYPQATCPDGNLVIRAMTTGDESLMQGATKDNVDARMNRMIAGCIVAGWHDNLGRMAVADRMFLLYRLRILTHEGEYTFSCGCPKCEEESEYRIDLDKLPVTRLKEGVMEPLYVSLPLSKQRIGWRFLRVDDELEAHTYKRQLKQRGGKRDPLMPFQFARRIVSVDGQEDMSFDELFKFADNMHARDRRFWEKNIEEYSVGVETELELTCRNCGHNHTVNLPIDDDFFRPSLAGEPEVSTILASGVNVAYNPDAYGAGSSDGDASADAREPNPGVPEVDGRASGHEERVQPGAGASAGGQDAVTPAVVSAGSTEECGTGDVSATPQGPDGDGATFVEE